MEEEKDKITVNDGFFDLSYYQWDDNRFTDILVKKHPIDPDKAMRISRGIRDEISRMDPVSISLPVIEKMIEKKLEELGLNKSTPVHLDETVFLPRKLSLSENAKVVLERRYLRKNSKGKIIETPEQMFRRVARHIARAEKKYNPDADTQRYEDLFYELMGQLKFLPNSPTLMNAGRRLGQLAACFVLPVEDSMEAIFDSLKHAAIIHKSGGGTGFSFSRLRPKNSRVGTTGGVASGPVSFMKVFNTATEQVKQGGTRRGANMAILRVDHPDIMEFIACKKNEKALNNFNLSVGVTQAFMDAVREKRSYDLVCPNSGEKVSELDAGQVFDALVNHAWENGDPGVVFLDEINRHNPTPKIGAIESTNPCGEQPLLPMEACNLGSINLARHVRHKKDATCIDYESLRQTIRLSVRFLDNTIDMSQYPLPEIEAMVHGNRKIGLGVMGFADLLFLMQIPYNSPKALKTGEDVMNFIQKESHEASRDLAIERGVFPNFDKSVYARRKNSRYRNATTTTIAPTGTLSIIAGCSSGIEPLFALCFTRTVMDNDKLVEVNPTFEQVARERGFYRPELMHAISEKGNIREFREIPNDVKDVFVTAHDIAPEWHIRMQAAFQKHTDNAVSKTVNLPRDATVEDVRKIYLLAHALKCKGVTVYRDGSKEHQVLSVHPAADPNSTEKRAMLERPETLPSFTTKIKTGMGNLYVTVAEFDGRPFEVFATIGKSGKSTMAKTEAIGRLISLALRSGVKVEDIVEQVKGIRGEYTVFQNGAPVLSIPDAIGRVLEDRYVKEKTGKKSSSGVSANTLKGRECPDCKGRMVFEEGCVKCNACGYSKCG